jgi:hypothetical protein
MSIFKQLDQSFVGGQRVVVVNARAGGGRLDKHSEVV